jgi:putative sigma-54 modulation protein
MKVNVTGRHVKVTAEMESYATEKVGKFTTFFQGIQQADVTMDVEGLTHHVEISVLLGPGQKLFGKAEADDMYAAIDAAEAKLEKQIRRLHARMKSHRDRTRISEGNEEAAAETQEETYESVVRDMLEKDEG